ncbi:hypothetical protein MHF_0651 [Mycoplasma haemofelis Ohio2]|uniref:Uncharacterized protein n=1 Tax=Mycoplasma haemofelis (strain Ohio2) TaxID=859194 RepID=F6FI75_MYCHI|nr:hypothetical protein MHF_0651 [Mycoplasma haemofelis Ohio2]
MVVSVPLQAVSTSVQNCLLSVLALVSCFFSCSTWISVIVGLDVSLFSILKTLQTGLCWDFGIGVTAEELDGSSFASVGVTGASSLLVLVNSLGFSLQSMEETPNAPKPVAEAAVAPPAKNLTPANFIIDLLT